MKKTILSLLSSLIVLTILISAVITASSADADIADTSAPVYTGETRNRDIISGNSYNYYNEVPQNYLRATSNGYMRLYGGDDGKLMIENYDRDFNYISTRYITTGILPLFGGFYESDNYYFIVTGQNNPNENDGLEVIRISRFDKNWSLPAAYVSIRAANTTVPFDAGGCDFAAYGENLFIRTAHEMYADSNNINHQATLTIVLNINSLNVKCYGQAAAIASMGYLSHSFNQFVATDTDGTIVCLDHGDGHPRTIALGRFLAKAEKNVFYDGIFNRNRTTYEYTSIINPEGRIGDNITGVMVGGLEISSTHYLTVGSSVEQNAYYQTNHAFNAYISATDKSASMLSAAQTKLTYLTSFTEADNRFATNPQLVKITDDRFLVMWNEMPVFTYYDQSYGIDRYLTVNYPITYDENCVMKYVFVNGKGELVSSIMTAPYSTRAYVSDCEPIVHNNKVIWYVSDGDEFANIVMIDMNGRITVRRNIIPDDLFAYPVDLSKAHVAFRDLVNGVPSGVNITASNINQYFVVTYKGKELVYGKDYTISGYNYYMTQGSIPTIVLGLYPVAGRSFLPLYYKYDWWSYKYYYFINGADRDSAGVHLDVAVYTGVGYYVYRSELDAYGNYGEYELVGMVKDRFQESFTDTTTDYSKAYLYAIREFTYDKNGNEVISDLSSPYPVYELPYIPTEAPTDPPTEPPTDPPTEPQGDPVLLGDVDSDEVVTILDATLIQRLLAGLVGEERVNRPAADVDYDSDVAIIDATAIQRYLAGFNTNYPIGEVVLR